MWTNGNRAKYNRDYLRYPSDLSNDEWAVIEPLIPPAKCGGGKRRVNVRCVVNGIMYILSTGCQCRYLPTDLQPRSTVHDYMLYVRCRERLERDINPTACVLDSQSVKSAEKGGHCIDSHGFDAGKLIKGKKRHILVDTQGLLLHGIVTSASVQDRDGGVLLLSTLFGMFPFLRRRFADSAYGGPIFHTASATILPRLEIEIIKRSDQIKGFVVLPKRWIVERTIAWLNRCRRLARDWEFLNRKALAFLKLASIRLMLRKLCNPL